MRVNILRYAAGTALTTGLSYSHCQEFPQLVQRYVECNFRPCIVDRSVLIVVPAAYGGSAPF